MKFLVPNYSCLQNPCLRGYRLQTPVLSVLCPQLNLLNPPPEKNSWVRHCIKLKVSRKLLLLTGFASLFQRLLQHFAVFFFFQHYSFQLKINLIRN